MYNQKKKGNRVSHKRPRIWGFSTGGHMWSVADSCQCFAKATTILQSSYPPIKIIIIIMATNFNKKGKKEIHWPGYTWGLQTPLPNTWTEVLQS